MAVNEVFSKASDLDKHDPLSSFRNKFVISDTSKIYLDGNSLGRLPKRTVEIVDQILKQEWGNDLIGSWNKSWYTKASEIGDKIAAIIGADKGEVIVSDNTSTNLYKLVYAALAYQQGRKKIITDVFNFPSDVYIMDGLVKQKGDGYHIEFIKSKDEISIDENELCNDIDDDTALVSLSHVAFKSAFMYDMKKVTDKAHERGALVLWDLSHSVGALPIELKKCNVDLAIGCTYKYLNGGPGAPAFLYVRKDLQEKLSSPIQGWFGANDPFEFNLKYAPSPGIRRFLTGTPPIISISGIGSGLDLILDAGIKNIRHKSMQLSSFFIELFERELSHLGFSLATPMDSLQRGSHISIKHQEAFRIVKALADKSVDEKSIIPDFRAPDNIRFGFAPLYNSFEDIYHTIQKLIKITTLKLFEHYDLSKEKVT